MRISDWSSDVALPICHGRAPTGRAQRPSSGGRCRRCPPRRSFDAQRLAQLLILAAALFFLLPLHRLVAPLPRCNFGLAAVGAPVLDIDDLLARPELPDEIGRASCRERGCQYV